MGDNKFALPDEIEIEQPKIIKAASQKENDFSTAPILSRNVPEPTSYTGKYYVKLPFAEEEYFSPTQTDTPDFALKLAGGENDYVEISQTGQLDLFDDLTICIWVKFHRLGNSALLMERHTEYSGDYRIVLNGGSLSIELYGHHPLRMLLSADSIAPYRWYHIAVTRQGKTGIVYLNGEERHRANSSSAGTPGRKVLPLYLGRYLDGLLDQIQLWNRALSQEEINAYKDGILSGYEEGLVGCWSMNDGRGTKVQDISPNQLPGIFNGNVSWAFSDRATVRRQQAVVDKETLKAAFDDAVQQGLFNPAIFPNVGWITTDADRLAAMHLLKDESKSLTFAAFEKRYKAGERLRIFRGVTGSLGYDFVRDPSSVESSMFLIETYRLSSFLGTYGVGRTIKTFSLLPGEKSKISISTYKKTKESAASASSVLDSYSDESAQDFASEMATERADTSQSDSSFAWHAEAEAEASWGWGSAKVSGSASGSSNASRESFAKSVANVTSKHAAKASARRDVQINTSSEVETEEGEETAIQREIENINVSRTLNFVFRQMNQEYITLLHLVDVKIGFGTSGIPQSRRIVPLAELDELIDAVIVDDADKRQYVRDFIIGELENIRDYQDMTVKEHQQADPGYPNFVDRVSIVDADLNEVDFYYRLRKDFTSVYLDPATSTEIKVPGILVNAGKLVMRTDDVLVDSLLGDGDALDEYSQGLQNEAVRAERVNNEFLDLRNQLLYKIVNAPNKETAVDAAELYQVLFGQRGETSEE